MVGVGQEGSYDEDINKKELSMKHYFRILLIMLFFLPSLACGALNTKSVDGSGNLETQTFSVASFDSVTLAGFGNVFIQQGEVENLSVQTDDNILPLLDIKVTGRELKLGMKPNLNVNPSQSITYNVTVKDLKGVLLQGSGNFYVEPVKSSTMSISLLGSGDITFKGLNGDGLSIDLSGSGNITIDDIKVKTLDTSVKGSGDVKLTGTADTQKVSIMGSGNYLAGNLETASADISIPGSADVTVWTTNTLRTAINGSGNIRYYGRPTIDQSGLGSGKLISLGEK